MSGVLRMAGAAMAVALVLATPGVAAADEPAAGVGPAAPAATTTSAESAAPATAADGDDASECDAAAAQAVPGDEPLAQDQGADDRGIGDEGTGSQEAPDPTGEPCPVPADQQGDDATGEPTDQSSPEPADQASPEPGDEPSTPPTDEPTDQAGEPTSEPTGQTTEPSDEPTGQTTEPSDEPTGQTTEPTRGPTAPPIDRPVGAPAAAPDVAAPAGAGQHPNPGTPLPAAPASSGGPVGAPPVTGVIGAATRTMSPLAVLTTMPAGPSPLTVPFAAVDTFPAYDPQVFCDPTPKPGTEYLARLAISYFGAGHLSGISRDCSVGPTSEHKEGRAFDWALNVDVPREKAAGDAFSQWLTAVGPDGKVGYNARRLGVMYIIWNGQIWLNSEASASWHAYRGPSPHTDHVHVSLTWAGAYERTSWWTGDPIPDRAELARLAGQAWARVFGHEPDAAVLAAWISRLADRGPLPVGRVELSRLAGVFAVVLDAGRWGLDRPAPERERWATTVSRSVV